MRTTNEYLTIQLPPATPPLPQLNSIIKLDQSFPKEKPHEDFKTQQICTNDSVPVLKLLTSKEELILFKSKLNMELKAELFKSCLSLDDFDKNFLQNEEKSLSPDRNEKKSDSKLFSQH